jgi:hypothetical protein
MKYVSIFAILFCSIAAQAQTKKDILMSHFDGAKRPASLESFGQMRKCYVVDSADPDKLDELEAPSLQAADNGPLFPADDVLNFDGASFGPKNVFFSTTDMILYFNFRLHYIRLESDSLAYFEVFAWNDESHGAKQIGYCLK